jgi:hypothetical protein
VVVDTVAPVGGVIVSVPEAPPGMTRGVISPDGDGVADRALLQAAFAEAVGGTVEVRSGGSTIWVGSIAPGIAGSTFWDGRTRAGTVVDDGRYVVRFTASDVAGNRSVVTSEVRVDRSLGSLVAEPAFWHPSDGDALASRSAFSFRLARNAATTLRVLAGDQVIRTAWSRRSSLPGTYIWSWDGRDEAGALVPQGVYTVEVVASRPGLVQVVRRSTTLRAFGILPSVRTVTAGSTLTVTVSTAERLRGAPTISFRQPGLAAVRVTGTAIPGGRWRAVFDVVASAAGTGYIVVSGTDTGGGRNISSTTIRVR